MPQRRNPVAMSPLLRKGGVHAKSKSSKRAQQKQALREEVDEVLLRPENDSDRSTHDLVAKSN